MNMRCEDRDSRIREIPRDLEIFKTKMDGLHTDFCEIGMYDLGHQLGKLSLEVGVMIETLSRMP